MNVTALGADIASAGWIGPIKVEERRGGGVQLRFAFPECVVAANQALQFTALDFDSHRIGLEQTHKSFPCSGLLPVIRVNHGFNEDHEFPPH